MLRKKLHVAVISLLLITIAFGGIGEARQAGTYLSPPTGLNDRKSSQVIMVIMDKVVWEEFDEARAPFINKLIREGAVGLMSNHTAVALSTTARSYTTIGTGNRALVLGDSGNALDAGEKLKGVESGILYERQTGLDPGDNQVFYLNMTGLIEANVDVGYTVVPGLIGQAVHDKGLATAVFGNADTDDRQLLQRQAAIIAMDENGAVDFGQIGRDILEEDELSPYGLRTDYDKIVDGFRKVEDKAALVVIETGDSRRVEDYRRLASEEVSKRYMMDAVSRADLFIKRLYNEIDATKSTLIIVSPSPPLKSNGLINQQLTPIIFAGAGVKNGYLTSASTGREAMVVSTDIAPTVLNLLGLDVPDYLAGQNIESKPAAGNKLARLIELDKSFVVVHEITLPVIIGYVVFQIFTLLLAVLILFGQTEVTKTTARIISVLILAGLSMPLGLFVAPAIKFSVGGPVIYITMIVAVTALVVIAALLNKERRFWPLFFISILTIAFLTGNLIFFGAESDLWGIFGYSPIVAGRFYGMGNQTMSVMLAAALVAASIYMEKYRRTREKFDRLQPPRTVKNLVLGFFIVCLFIIGFPALGANTGGIITALVGFSAAYVYFFNPAISVRRFLLLVLLGAALFTAFIAADIYLLPTKTHMGRAVMSIINGGPERFRQIAERKLTANIRIFKYTTWSYLFLTITIILIYFRFFRKNGSDESFSARYPYLSAGLNGGLVAGIIGAMTNDSGISITAIILAYFLAVIFYLQLGDKYLFMVAPSPPENETAEGDG